MFDVMGMSADSFRSETQSNYSGIFGPIDWSETELYRVFMSRQLDESKKPLSELTH